MGQAHLEVNSYEVDFATIATTRGEWQFSLP